MATKQRYQNPTPGDIVRLRLFSYNSNLPQNISSVESVKTYYLDPSAVSASNPDGRTLIDTLTSGVVNEDSGSYYLDLTTSSPKYVVGNYLDVWSLVLESGTSAVTFENGFSLYPRKWYTTVLPVVYDFSFNFQPNRFVQGSKKWMIIEIVPRVPRMSDLERYYLNLAIYADLSLTIAKKCDPCLPVEKDLRVVVEDAVVEQREKCFGYYWLDTSEMDEGVYDITFTLNHGGNTYVSEKNQLLIVC